MVAHGCTCHCCCVCACCCSIGSVYSAATVAALVVVALLLLLLLLLMGVAATSYMCILTNNPSTSRGVRKVSIICAKREPVRNQNYLIKQRLIILNCSNGRIITESFGPVRRAPARTSLLSTCRATIHDRVIIFLRAPLFH